MKTRHEDDAKDSFRRDNTAFRSTQARPALERGSLSEDREAVLLALRRIKAAIESDIAANDGYDQDDRARVA